MSKYDLLLRASVIAPSTTKPQFQAVTPPGPNNPNMPPQTQAFQLTVSGVGAVSATAQIIVSNDSGGDPSQYDWVNYGDPVSASGTTVGIYPSGGNQPWRHYGAYLTAISGTNAAATLRMMA